MSRAAKLEDLKKRIAGKGRLLVAFSGGVDSSLLAKVANDVLGDYALAVILDSETLPRSELKQARELAESLGLNYMVAEFSILTDEDFTQNPATQMLHLQKKIRGSSQEHRPRTGHKLHSRWCQPLRLQGLSARDPGLRRRRNLASFCGFRDHQRGYSIPGPEPRPRQLEQAFLCLPLLTNSLWGEDHRRQSRNGRRGRGLSERLGIRTASGKGSWPDGKN